MDSKKGNFVVGDKIPSFKSVNENGEPITSENILGYKTILFFYGQDDTPTCTKEACNLRDNYKIFSSKGYKIYGVSKDTEKKHKKFIDKYDLPYSLIADTEITVMNAFGYFGPKVFMGKHVTGVYRTTIVIDEFGIITHIIDNVVSGDHANQLKSALGI
jgi:peroxiredoxin Q/BCP